MRAYPSQRFGRPPHPKDRYRNEKKGRRLFRWFGKTFLILALLIVLLSFLLVLPLRWVDPTTTAFMLQDNSGIRPLQREWVDWSDIGDALPIAVVAAEDQKFAGHMGFDVASIRNSVDEYSQGQSLRGASTITQQVAKNLYLWPSRSFLRKGIEAYFAVLLEAVLSKSRILEIYLNIAEFGSGIYGAGAASESYFGKAPSALEDTEAALLAAVLPSPKRLHVGRPSSYLRERQSWIIGNMERLRREQWILSLE
jgi:monofunctional biosynthetic peptidoglycan transglycosylase